MKIKFKGIICLLLLISIIFSLGSCAGKLTKDEALDVANDLIERAYILNIVCYGEGLRYDETENDLTKYSFVQRDEPFQTKRELCDEIDAVFSKEIASAMKEVSFEPLYSIDPEKFADPRYQAAGDDDYLKVYKKIECIIDGGIRIPNIEKTEITKVKRKKIKGNIIFENGDSAEFLIIKENGAWKLDTFTY